MKRMLLHKIICAILAVAVLCSSAVFSANADTNQKAFDNVEDLRETVIDIFNDNYTEFLAIAKSLTPDVADVPDEYFTFYSNCCQSSSAFRKVLYDRNIIVETHRAGATYTHVYNLMRTSFSESPDTVSCIVIDPTYKQFVTDNYVNAGFSLEDMANDLPEVMVYEYGNKQQLEEQLEPVRTRLGDKNFDIVCTEVYSTHYYYEYMIPDMQYLEYNQASKGDIHYTPQMVDDLRNNSGIYESLLSETPYLFSRTNNAKKAFVHDGNGVYRCYIEQAEFATYANGFTITNEDGNLLYGMNSSGEKLEFFNRDPHPSNNLKRLSNIGGNTLSLNIQSLSKGIMITFDLRSGVNNPVIYAFKVFKTALYGDINGDSSVDINDVTMLQKYISGYGSITLTQDAQEAADVLKFGASNVNNATEISKYIADLKDFNCGTTLYYSYFLDIGLNPSYGYIDF